MDVAIIEVADGPLQPETAAILRTDWFRGLADAVLFAAADPLAAMGGVELLRVYEHRVLGVGGRLTRSPLHCREVALATDLPVMGSADLGDAATAKKLVADARDGRRAL